MNAYETRDGGVGYNLNDIAYTLFFISKVQQGEKEIEEGKGISHEEAIKITRSWEK